MADPAQFGHDRLAHLLSDRLLSVPRFQRGYSWEPSNVAEFLDDLKTARSEAQPYFMGTVVLADDAADPSRQSIVDGQQRLTTTAILVAAVRDRLRQLNKPQPADVIDKGFLRTFDLEEEDNVTRLKLNAEDVRIYENILAGQAPEDGKHPIESCYRMCLSHLTDVAPSEAHYRDLINVVTHLDKSVQVLLAVASGLPEAYVIFETLNDRGADLTTADLLKNYLFSQSRTYLDHVEQQWSSIARTFDKPEDLVKFIRHEHSSREGKVTTRKLYKVLQSSIGRGQKRVRDYVGRLEDSLQPFIAIKEPDSEFWGRNDVDVRDSLLAFRRFGFESSMPLLLAILNSWEITPAAKMVNKVAGWSVRAWFAGRLGGGTAEEAFSEAAVAVSSGQSRTQDDVFKSLAKLIPTDQEFRQAVIASGAVSTGRAKYLLAQMERQRLAQLGVNVEAQPDWSGKSVSVEHVLARSSKPADFPSSADYERFQAGRDSLKNYTLLERTLNRKLADKPFTEKALQYQQSKFLLTRELGQKSTWTLADSDARAAEQAKLAIAAWPYR
ncbi:DUF262 domain-containing HNH endonuclease family protein [Streptomyces sp. ME02-6979.5a]|uniref:DUF262 domain-containing protein n=1 Tax=Streptomyces sp. ME02-6979.5a TaxID=462925 RepID=UPI0029A6DEC7|nr:DUF262 domain-containing HNH endonuclease family protein [Streptomyces sp. ME02-6979.5a]MDX3337267.1 DUF262 domain-containing HNH endonuclease family protein [Streptomyces sp. ME02-6979.5a]